MEAEEAQVIIKGRLKELLALKEKMINEGAFSKIRELEEIIYINKVWAGEEDLCLFTLRRESKK